MFNNVSMIEYDDIFENIYTQEWGVHDLETMSIPFLLPMLNNKADCLSNSHLCLALCTYYVFIITVTVLVLLSELEHLRLNSYYIIYHSQPIQAKYLCHFFERYIYS